MENNKYSYLYKTESVHKSTEKKTISRINVKKKQKSLGLTIA
jgi:hypothetical protein